MYMFSTIPKENDCVWQFRKCVGSMHSAFA